MNLILYHLLIGKIVLYLHVSQDKEFLNMVIVPTVGIMKEVNNNKESVDQINVSRIRESRMLVLVKIVLHILDKRAMADNVAKMFAIKKREKFLN